jgi:hypothetical protein
LTGKYISKLQNFAKKRKILVEISQITMPLTKVPSNMNNSIEHHKNFTDSRGIGIYL